MSFRSGMAVWSCVAVLVLAGCSGGGEQGKSSSEGSKDAAVRESAEPSGPQDPRLQGEPLTLEQTREELCDQVVEYFPDDMVLDVSTAASKDETDSTCEIEGVEVGSGVTVKFTVSTWMLAPNRSVEQIDSKLRSDDPVCDKVLFSSDGQSSFQDVNDATGHGERPDEYCGVRFTDEGHMSTRFVENAQNLSVEMWLDPPDSVEQYDVREEIMPYIMEGTREFHNDRLSVSHARGVRLREMLC